jgi:cell division initiation protein
MELTPNDIRNYEFQTQMRGYDKDEVDSLVKRLAEMFDQLKQDNLKFSMENDSLKSQLESLKELEETIKNATIDARKNADALLTNAKEEATKLVEEASAEAEERIGSKQEEHDELERKIQQLEETRKSFVDNLQGLISSHLTQLESTPPPAESSTDESTEEPRKVEDMSQEMLESISDSLEEDVDDEKEEEPTDEEQVDEQEDEEAESVEYDDEEDLEEEPQGLNPELASTANNYEHVTSEDVEEQTSAQDQEEPVSPLVNVVETTKTAEEIPDGFIAQDAEYANTNDTIPVGDYADSPSPKSVSTENNESDDDEMSPENLAATLDSVVAKFEEEMDKADKN